MFVGIVYESLFGNTRDIAEAIAAGIREAGPEADVVCCPVGEAGPELARADLLVVGAPTHFLGLPSARSRVMQLRYRPASGTWDVTGPQPRIAARISGIRPRQVREPALQFLDRSRRGLRRRGAPKRSRCPPREIGDVPNEHRRIFTSRGQALAVRRKGDRMGDALVPLE